MTSALRALHDSGQGALPTVNVERGEGGESLGEDGGGGWDLVGRVDEIGHEAEAPGVLGT